MPPPSTALYNVHNEGDRLTVATLDATRLTTTNDFATALDDGTIELARIILNTGTQNRRLAVDLRTADGESAVAGETMLQAIRGLIQAYALEAGSSAPAINMVVTNPGQDTDRAATWRFLDHPDGAMALGATFDLRRTHG